MSKRKCGLCGKDPAAGFASIDDTFYCHGDDDAEPTCYMSSQLLMIPALFDVVADTTADLVEWHRTIKGQEA